MACSVNGNIDDASKRWAGPARRRNPRRLVWPQKTYRNLLAGLAIAEADLAADSRRCSCGRPFRQRAAFTLIEVIVVALLTSMLMSAVAVVFINLLRSAESPAATTLSVVAQTQLSSDLANSDWYRIAPGVVELQGQLARDPVTHQTLWMPAQVRYQVVSTLSGPVLRRVQRVDSQTRPIFSSEPIWWGVRSIELTTNLLNTGPAARQPSSPAGEGWRPMPSAYSIRVRGEDGQLLFRSSSAGLDL